MEFTYLRNSHHSYMAISKSAIFEIKYVQIQHKSRLKLRKAHKQQHREIKLKTLPVFVETNPLTTTDMCDNRAHKVGSHIRTGTTGFKKIMSLCFIVGSSSRDDSGCRRFRLWFLLRILIAFQFCLQIINALFQNVIFAKYVLQVTDLQKTLMSKKKSKMKSLV